MPFDLHFLREHGLAVVQVAGPVTMLEIMGVGTTLFQSPHWRPGTKVLLDYRDASDITDGTYRAARTLAQQDQSFGELLAGTRVAVVAPSDVVFGIVRMWEALSEGGPWEARVFRDYEPALAWLEISAEQVPEPSWRQRQG